MIISIQGIEASFHSIACNHLFGNAKQIHRSSFAEVFDDVENSKADFGICAIENSSVGSINAVYDLLQKSDLKITNEIYLRIHQNLLGVKGSMIKDIKSVYSHPMAILQSEEYLEKHLPDADIHERHDTAESAKFIFEIEDKTKAAIAPIETAKIYGLKILARNIETDKHNYTRFIVLSKNTLSQSECQKTSIIVTAKNIPGSLHKILGTFAKQSINLSKIESRPIIGKGWNYYFYIDFESGLTDKKTIAALSELKKYTNSIKVLGSYPRGELLK